jgi:hypothetical protein
MDRFFGFLDKIFCELGFHVWSAPFVQKYDSPPGLPTLPNDTVCICIKEGCRGKQLFLDMKWLTIHGR